jgi:ADYC domain
MLRMSAMRFPLLAGCLVLALATLAGSASAGREKNGRFVNGRFVNGRFVNGRFVNGRFVNTALPNGGTVGTTSVGTMTRYGEPVYSTHVEGSEVTGWTYNFNTWTATRVGGTWFTGAEMAGSLQDPVTGEADAVTLRIDGVSTVTGNTYETGAWRPDYLHYQVSLGLPDGYGNTSYEPLCGYDDMQQRVPAIALRGNWDYSEGTGTGGKKASDDAYQLTFACENGALGKCAGKMKYSPWESDWVETCPAGGGPCIWLNKDLVDTHQACTRMVRADYCGDGRPHTVDGTDIIIYDDLLYQHNLPGSTSGYQWEGAWDKNGVARASCGRLQENVYNCPTYLIYVPGPTGAGIWIPTTNQHTFACYAPGTELAWSNAMIGNYRRLDFIPIGRNF